MSLQSKTIKELFAKKEIDSYQFVEMQRMVKDFYDQQGKSERIKTFPIRDNLQPSIHYS